MKRSVKDVDTTRCLDPGFVVGDPVFGDGIKENLVRWEGVKDIENISLLLWACKNNGQKTHFIPNTSMAKHANFAIL